MLTAGTTGQGVGQESAMSPPVPPPAESGASAVSKGLSGAGDTDPRPPGQQQRPPAHLPDCVSRAAPLSCKHPPWAREVGARASDVDRGAWAAGDAELPQPTGAGRWGRDLPPPARPGLAPAGSSPGPPWLQAAALASVHTLAHPGLHALRRVNRALRPGSVLPEEPGNHVGQE